MTELDLIEKQSSILKELENCVNELTKIRVIFDKGIKMINDTIATSDLFLEAKLLDQNNTITDKYFSLLTEEEISLMSNLELSNYVKIIKRMIYHYSKKISEEYMNILKQNLLSVENKLLLSTSL